MADRTNNLTQGSDHEDAPRHQLQLDVFRLDLWIRSDGPDGPTAVPPWMVTCQERGSRAIVGFEIFSDEPGSKEVERLLMRSGIRVQPE